jgi:hypothetical protein
MAGRNVMRVNTTPGGGVNIVLGEPFNFIFDQEAKFA